MKAWNPTWLDFVLARLREHIEAHDWRRVNGLIDAIRLEKIGAFVAFQLLAELPTHPELHAVRLRLERRLDGARAFHYLTDPVSSRKYSN